MFFSEKKIEYIHLKYYIEAYLTGIDEVYDSRLLIKISKWYQTKVGQEFSIYWTTQIPYTHPNKTEEELKIILLDTLEEYFVENSYWYKKENA
jgi:hypothetical protein